MSDKVKILEKRLETVKVKEEEIDLLNDIAFELKYNEPAKAISYLEDSLSKVDSFVYDSGKARSMQLLSACYFALSDYDKSISYGKEASGLYKKIGSVNGVANSLQSIGNAYCSLGDYLKALDYSQESLKINKEIKKDKAVASNLNNIGNIYESLGEYETALEYYYESLKIKNSIDDSVGKAYTLINIGLIYIDIKNYDKAFENLKDSLKIMQGIGNLEGEADALNNIGIIERRKENYESALSYYVKVLELRKRIGEKHSEAGVLINIGETYLVMKKYDNAMKYCSEGIEIARNIKNREYESIGLRIIGDVYSIQGKNTEALEKLKESLKIAEELGSKKLLYETHLALANYYKEIKDHEKGYKHFIRYYEIEKEVLNEKMMQKMNNLAARYEVQSALREKEIAEKEKELIKGKNVELEKALTKVESLNKHLLELDFERKELLGIVAHDLRNPLADIIMTARTLLKNEIDISKDEARDLVYGINKNSEKMLTLLKSILELNKIETGKYTPVINKIEITELLTTILEDFKKKAEVKCIKFHYHSDGSKLNALADYNASHQVFENIISNAVKYSPIGGNVYINVNRKGKNIRTEVRDEGEGLSSEDIKDLFKMFQKLSTKPTGDESSTGLGLSIVKKLVDMMKGNVWCESKRGEGANFIIELPAQ